MKRTFIFLSVILLSMLTNAQSKKLTGVWDLVSVESVAADGSVSFPYGASPVGQLIFTADGYYAIQILKAGRAAIVSGNKNSATPEENLMMVQGNNSHFGKFIYSSNDSSIVYKVSHAFFPNWEGKDLNTKIVLEKDLLKSYSSNTTFGSAKAVVTWRRK